VAARGAAECQTNQPTSDETTRANETDDTVKREKKEGDLVSGPAQEGRKETGRGRGRGTLRRMGRTVVDGSEGEEGLSASDRLTESGGKHVRRGYRCCRERRGGEMGGWKGERGGWSSRARSKREFSDRLIGFQHLSSSVYRDRYYRKV
jgi:hypothetical protein